MVAEAVSSPSFLVLCEELDIKTYTSFVIATANPETRGQCL